MPRDEGRNLQLYVDDSGRMLTWIVVSVIMAGLVRVCGPPPTDDSAATAQKYSTASQLTTARAKSSALPSSGRPVREGI